MSGWKYAFSLSKEEIREATPPGTVRLVDHHVQEKILEAGDQHLAPNNDEVVRFPRPSSDPADPLNWAPWRKLALLLVAGLYAFVGNYQSAAIAPALSTWYTTFPSPADYHPFPTLVHLVAVNVLMIGASNIWWVPLSNILGRRPVLLAASLLMTLASVWAGLAGPAFPSLLAARIFQGIGGGPSETVAPALIGEVFFVDERGRAMAVYTALLALGSLVGGISGGYIGHEQGWAWIFWVTTILSALLFLGILFFVPETLYDRSAATMTTTTTTTTRTTSSQQQQQQQLGESSSSSKEGETFVEDTRAAAAAAAAAAQTTTNTATTNPPSHGHRPYTFTRSLGFLRPQAGGHAILSHFLQPWKTLALPGTWVVMLHYAGLVGGIVTISTIGAQLVQEPPYLWGANAGLVNLGGLVGVTLGALYTYLTSDARLLGRAKHEGHGFAEPESRLPTMFPCLAVATGGFFIFGFCAQYPGPNRWVGLEVGYAMLSFGLMQVPSIGFNYLIDAYTYLAGDCFVVVTILRSIIAFAWTFFVSDWISSKGAAEPFGIFGMLMGLFSLLVIPLWLFGKRMRVATASVLDR